MGCLFVALIAAVAPAALAQQVYQPPRAADVIPSSAARGARPS